MSQREDLEALRVGLIAAFGNADDAVKAQIAGQLRGVLKDLAALPVEDVGEVSKADEIAARRKARGSVSADRASSAGRSQPRRRGGSNRTG